MNAPKKYPSGKQILVNLLHFFSLEASDQQSQLSNYGRLVVERKKQAHVDDPLIELATDLQVWSDRCNELDIDEITYHVLCDLSELLELILIKDQEEMVSVDSLATKRHWNIVRRFCKEALRQMNNPRANEHSSVWDMLALS